MAFFEWLEKMAEVNKNNPAWTLESFIKDNYDIKDEAFDELEGQYTYFLTNRTL